MPHRKIYWQGWGRVTRLCRPGEEVGITVPTVFFFFLSLYAFPPKGALGYQAECTYCIEPETWVLCRANGAMPQRNIHMYGTIRGLLLASHQLLAIPATPRQQHLQPHLVVYHDDGDSSYIHNYGSEYALQHGYPHALPYLMQYPIATSSIWPLSYPSLPLNPSPPIGWISWGWTHDFKKIFT